MAGRPALGVGELGSVKCVEVNGRFRGRARTRGAAGIVRRLTATSTSPEKVEQLLQEQADELAIAVRVVDGDSELGTFLALWLEDRQEEVKIQSMRVYRSTAEYLTGTIGAIPVKELTPARLKGILKEIGKTRDLHQVRTALNGALGIAVELDAILHNPIASLRRKKPRRGRPKALSVAQVWVLREVILEREAGVAKHGGPAGARILRWVVELMLASGLRISEVCALRNMDVDLQAGTIAITGTMIEDEHYILIRQDELKARDQARIIKLPQYGCRTLQEARSAQETIPSRLPQSPALHGRRGNTLDPRKVRKALIKLREHPRLVEALAVTGLKPTDLTPHLLRRTAATLVAAASGNIIDAQELLGHAHASTTKQAYLGEAFFTVGSAQVLDEILGERAAQ
ncbi:tyrosine recombinase XerC [Microbacterium sp. ZW T5_56]|uniref:site-specific integrase n=1 Tax=Microbacterium sp. ZW T5_56 TaxID=3378081 RepID=UPI003853B00D